MVMQGLLPLVMAIAVALAPVALEACQAVCAMSVETTTATHSCHDPDEAPKTAADTLAAAPHACGHSAALPESVPISLPHTVSVPAVIPALFAVPPPAERLHPSSDTSPPRAAPRIAITGRLRV